MKIVFFAHPLFLGSQSMPRFVTMLSDGMAKRGHQVEIWRPEALFLNFPLRKIRKWLGYIDQYVLFPRQVKARLKKINGEVLYVFADNALGPYVPLVSEKAHIVHCHDFLAQRSAKGEIAENLTSASGKAYQAFIQRGYSQGKNFISVSEKTRQDLSDFLKDQPLRSEMVYNGLSSSFRPGNVKSIRETLGAQFQVDLSAGYILHVGGNQWYKNRTGVVMIYEQWRRSYSHPLPLLLIGQSPAQSLLEVYQQSSFKADIHFLTGLTDEQVRLAYAGASVFLFPSLAEGFGWPIAEAMASGTLVITTNQAPMLEVAGDAAFLINRRPQEKQEEERWAMAAADILEHSLHLSADEKAEWIARAQENIRRFDLEEALDNIEQIYLQVFTDHHQKSRS